MATSAVQRNGYTNGVNGHNRPASGRFSDIPAVIDIPVRGEDGENEAVNLDLTELLDETDELCDLLENENAAKIYWITIALAYAKQGKVDVAVEMLKKGLTALSRARSEDRLSVLTCLCWLYLWKCRHAPRVKPSPAAQQQMQEGRDEQHEVKTKDHWLHAATSALNEASRINPSYPPLFLARGTLYLLRASLQPSINAGGREGSERAETLKQAAKCFDDSYRLSGQRNLMAMFGKAKVHYSLAQYPHALTVYQQILERAPDLTDPDPRIGIGCCLWQLGHKQPARHAWERSLEINDTSNVAAHILLGLAYLDESAQYPTNSPEFADNYKKAMTTHTQAAFKMDGMHALTCSTFGSYFVLRKAWPNVERLARRAIEMTDVNAVASDGWYLLARREHHEGTDMAKANEYYSKADQARGGDEKGYLPAKFGLAQLKVLMRDFDSAKFRLEKIVSGTNSSRDTVKSVEALTLLGVLHAEEVFANQAAGGKEDLSMEQKKAVALLEQVRVAWKDAKRRLSPDPLVLLNLARLYETEAPERALACLEQVEKMELDEIAEDDERLPEEIGHEEEERRLRRALLSPQLLNNIGCFRFEAGKFAASREDLQTALNACVKIGDKEDGADTDALVTTISFNLARTYEAEGMHDEAKQIYEGLLDRHPDYTDAKLRLTLIVLLTNPAEGTEQLNALLEQNPANLEVRALYGWWTNKTKKRAPLPDDAEQKHYKHTLQTYDKHDLYSLTGMGNLHLAFAREMRRDTDVEKDKRSKMYMRAVEFFDKVLTLDAKNAFAAQGLGIAMVEEKKDSAASIQVFSKVRESVKGVSPSVHLNLGHVFSETKQWSRSIENYELALSKSSSVGPHGNKLDASILTCLGRVWLMRGRQEKKLDAYKTALDFSRQALEVKPEDINARFNVAFVQIQLAQLLISLPEAQRSLADVEQASHGLDEAIDAFLEIAKDERRPFPRGDLEARANMGRNTMKRQLALALEKQAAYEKANAARLEEARKRREEEMLKREAERQAAAERAEEQRRKIKEERERMAEEDRRLIERRVEDEQAKEAAEWTDDPETGERKKREKRARGEKRAKRKKKAGADEEGEDGDGLGLESGTPGATGSDAPEPQRSKKRRRLEKKGQAVKSSKYKSAEMVEDSSDEDRSGQAGTQPQTEGEEEEELEAVETPNGDTGEDEMPGDEDEEEAGVSRPSQRKKMARVLDDDDDDGDQDERGPNGVDIDVDVAGVDIGVTTAGEENHG